MAGVFDPSQTTLSEPSRAGANFTQSGVVDTSTAQTVEALGNVTQSAVKGFVQSELEGKDDNADFVDPTDPEFSEMTLDDVVGNLNLTTIAAARKQGKLTGPAAAALVNSKTKELVNRFPFLSQEIKQETQRFFQGTGLNLSDPLFKDPDDLFQKAKEAAVKRMVALGADPLQGEEEFFRTGRALLDQDRLKNEMSFRKSQLDLDEATQDQAEKQDFNTWMSRRSVSVQSDISRTLTEIQDASPEDQIVRLEALKQDIDAETRRTFEVDRIGTEVYNNEFKALISNRIDLETRRINGDISKSYYENQVAIYKAKARDGLFSNPAVAQAEATLEMFRNLPAPLLESVDVVNQLGLAHELVKATEALRAGSLKNPPPVTAAPTPEAKLFYEALRSSMNGVRDGTSNVENLEGINQEISFMLNAHAKGVARNAEDFDVGRWDELMNFFSSQDAFDYISKNQDSFTPSAREGMRNIIQFEFGRQLLGDAQAKFEQSLNTAIPQQAISGIPATTFRKPVSDFVEVQTSNGQMNFAINPDTVGGLNPTARSMISEQVQNLNRNYGQRINQYVKTLSHLTGSNNYNETLTNILASVELGQQQEEAAKEE